MPGEFVGNTRTDMVPSSASGDPFPMANDVPPEMVLGHVLIVEDEEGLADLFRDYIQRFYRDGATVHVAPTVADAEATLETLSAIDIALIDRTLPDGDGADLLPLLHSKFEAITVMVTGTSPETTLIELSVDDYLQKPVDEDELIQRLSLLEKLDASGVLHQYSDARKASLLEYHLDDPEQDPVFRRFNNKWSYDRLEIAAVGNQRLVYALYTGGGSEEDISVSIVGALGADLESLLAEDEIAPVGELAPADDGYTWVEARGQSSINTDPDSITIYEFTRERPERYITDTTDETEGMAHRELREILESEFS